MRYAIFATDTMNLGVAYIISYLRKYGHEVHLIFEPVIFQDDNNILKRVKDINPNTCLFSCCTYNYQWSLKIAKRIKDECGYKIIFGGIHVTSCPDTVRENNFIDDICIGCGIRYLGYDFNPDEVFPARQDFYKQMPPHFRIQPYMMTSFTCPFNCSFCTPQSLKLKMKRRSIDGCIKEIAELKQWGAKRLYICDDTFTLDKSWVTDFCREYKKQINIPFHCVTHPKLIKEDIVIILKEAGCKLIGMGIQCGNERIRKDILKRPESNDEFIEACRIIKKHGMKLPIDHIFQLPEETKEVCEESYQLYKKANPDLINCFNLVYLPKTEILNYALKNNIISKENIKLIEQGIGNNFAIGEHYRYKKVNPYVKKYLALPLGGGAFERFPICLIKILCYIKMDNHYIVINIIQNHAYFFFRKVLICLKNMLSV
jgi:anaerobic magnesium-protoporphyrin IX monomethyl ester cyclase